MDEVICTIYTCRLLWVEALRMTGIRKGAGTSCHTVTYKTMCYLLMLLLFSVLPFIYENSECVFLCDFFVVFIFFLYEEIKVEYNQNTMFDGQERVKPFALGVSLVPV